MRCPQEDRQRPAGGSGGRRTRRVMRRSSAGMGWVRSSPLLPSLSISHPLGSGRSCSSTVGISEHLLETRPGVRQVCRSAWLRLGARSRAVLGPGSITQSRADAPPAAPCSAPAAVSRRRDQLHRCSRAGQALYGAPGGPGEGQEKGRGPEPAAERLYGANRSTWFLGIAGMI
jgi:hypothetical protein